METNVLSEELLVFCCQGPVHAACSEMDSLMWTAFSLFDRLFCVSLIRLTPDVSGSSVAERVKRGIEPFLRCAALFFNCLTGVPPPEELFNIAGQWSIITLKHTEYEDLMNELIQANIFVLCSYLSRTDGGALQLFGCTLQCVPALPGAQRHFYSTAAEVGDEHLVKLSVFD